ncbi:hypothetical protein [Wenzhouxiangella sp. 15190]|uniref:hypothetical protein n=1 Tax=Wenzhouxiangella sp. 15190 TaxID=2301225 RepID=UPI0011C056C3|nr:hypothetical protein [Wenzhouxiangella sp. 15190]
MLIKLGQLYGIEDIHELCPDNQSLRTRDNARKAFDGTYDSRFGQVKLKQRDLFLIGDYGDKGIIAGLWDGNSFRGHFTNEGRTGWFDFAFLSKNGSFQDGEWNWVGSDAPREWRLDKAADATPTLDNVTADIRCSG